MENPPTYTYSEDAAKELAAFAQEGKNLTDSLCRVIMGVARTGLTCYCWEHVRVLLHFVMDKNMRDFNTQIPDCGEQAGSTFEERRTQILGSLDSFIGPPFTLQRLCELLLEPHIYSSTRKYLNAVEKMFAVSQTLATLSPMDYDKEAAKQTASYLAIMSAATTENFPTQEHNTVGETAAKPPTNNNNNNNNDKDNSAENNNDNNNTPMETGYI